ncbi:hypothetical protein XELAEV_18010887mg [Xenopus laevis]|nr:hypothetical protein XELAEV_18010887mg [Xenopus laevis]
MTKLLTSYSRKLQDSFQEMISDEDNIQHKANSNASSVTSPTRENCAKQSVLDTLEDTKNRQRKLLLKESMTPLDAEEMCLIQDILNDVVTMQKDERDILAKKYRASVDSFKQGILTEKVTNLAGRQKILQQVVCQQKEVDQKITAHKQSKKSVVYRSEESSCLHSCNLSPGRNQIPAVCSVSAGPKANIANGSSMTSVVPAISGSPDLENSTVQDIFMRFTGNPEISDAGGNPANVFTAERRTENCISKLAFKEKPAFLGLEYSSSNHNTANPQNETNEHLDFTNTVSMSPNPGPLTSTGRTVVQNNDPPSVRDSCQMPHAGQHSKIYYTDMVSQQKENTSVSSVDNLTSIGKPHQRMMDKAPTSHVASIQNTPSQRSENLSAASSHARGASKGRIRKIHLKKLINAGTLKPGENVLEFKIQVVTF